MKIAYLTGRYPEVSHTFVMREIAALRRLGVAVRTFSIWRTKREQLLSEADHEAFRSTYALLPPRLGPALGAHLRAVSEAPFAYLSVAWRAMRWSRPGSRGRLLGLLWFFEAVTLWHECDSGGARHIHVHLNGTAPVVASLAAAFGRRSRKSVGDWAWSLTVHGPLEFYDVEGERLAAKVKDARFVICISHFARSQLMMLVPEAHWSKLHLVRCGVDSAYDDVATPSARPGCHVLSVGRLAPMKGQALLVSAFARLLERLPDARLTLVGEGPERTGLEQLIASLGVQDRVRLTGAVAQDRIQKHYRDADVFCLSSFAEGVPVVLMEAMSTGVPVVAPRTMGIPELVEDGINGLLVTPASSHELTRALERLALDPAERARMGAEGQRKIRAEYSVDDSAAQLLSILERHADNPAGGPGAPGEVPPPAGVAGPQRPDSPDALAASSGLTQSPPASLESSA